VLTALASRKPSAVADRLTRGRLLSGAPCIFPWLVQPFHANGRSTVSNHFDMLRPRLTFFLSLTQAIAHAPPRKIRHPLRRRLVHRPWKPRVPEPRRDRCPRHRWRHGQRNSRTPARVEAPSSPFSEPKHAVTRHDRPVQSPGCVSHRLVLRICHRRASHRQTSLMNIYS
jgi:hypothetical protein